MEDRFADDVFVAPTIGKPTAKIGYFRNREDFERFAAAYRDGMAELPEPAERAALPTSFGTVRAYRFGDAGGAPLVLLAGRQASTPMWRANLPGLMSHRTVWVMDSIGEPGASSQSRPLVDGNDQAAWLAEAIAGLGISRAHLMGSSIGGNLAMQVAMYRPKRAASITLLDPANTFAALTWKMITVSLGSAIPALPMSVRHRLLGWIAGGVRSDDSSAEGRLITSAMRGYHIAQPLLPRPDETQLRAIDVPALILLAGRSIVHDSAVAAENAERIPRARVELWPDASHALNGEYPERISTRLNEFIAASE